MSDDTVQCCGCTEMHQDVPAAALPDGWDALRIPGFEPALFCDACVGRGAMEQFRAQQGLPRRQRWRLAGILALYRPAARQVLLATPEGMAELTEQEAVLLHAALGDALAVRDLAGALIVAARL